MICTSCGYMTPMEASIIGRIDKQTKKRDKHMKSIEVAVGTVRSKDKLDVPIINSKGKVTRSIPNNTFVRVVANYRINGNEYYKINDDICVLKKYVVFKGGVTHEESSSYER